MKFLTNWIWCIWPKLEWRWVKSILWRCLVLIKAVRGNVKAKENSEGKIKNKFDINKLFSIILLILTLKYKY